MFCKGSTAQRRASRSASGSRAERSVWKGSDGERSGSRTLRTETSLAGSNRTRPACEGRASSAREEFVGRVLLDRLLTSGPRFTLDAPSSSSNGSLGSDVTDVILPADRRKTTALASVHIVGRGRELSALDRVEGVGQPLLRFGEDPDTVRGRRK